MSFWSLFIKRVLLLVIGRQIPPFARSTSKFFKICLGCNRKEILFWLQSMHWERWCGNCNGISWKCPGRRVHCWCSRTFLSWDIFSDRISGRRWGARGLFEHAKSCWSSGTHFSVLSFMYIEMYSTLLLRGNKWLKEQLSSFSRVVW